MGRNESPHSGLAEHGRALVERIAARAGNGVDLWCQARLGLRATIPGSTPLWPDARGIGSWFRRKPSVDLWHSLNQAFYVPPPRGAVSVLTVHDLNYKYWGGVRKLRRGERQMRRALRLHDHLIAISDFTAGDLLADFNRSSPVIHNGATSLVECASTRPEGAPDAGFVFHLSRMSTGKNIEAIVELVRSWPDQEFVLAGPERSDSLRVRKLVEVEGLDHVTVLLDISEAEKAWLYANCAAFLFPSRCEGFGLPVVEALKFGRPVAISRATSLPEVGGAEATYFDAFDPASMKRVVRAAIATQGDRDAQERREAQAAKFDWDRSAAAHCRLYNSLLGGEYFDETGAEL